MEILYKIRPLNLKLEPEAPIGHYFCLKDFVEAIRFFLNNSDVWIYGLRFEKMFDYRYLDVWAKK